MRFLIAAALLACSVPAMAQDRSFDMMGLKTDQVYNGDFMVAGKKCKLKAVGLESCVRAFGAVIGSVQVWSFQTNFRDGKLYSTTGQTPTTLYPMLVEAFEAKYGPAVKTDSPAWQNQMGATFENVVKLWTFRNGGLEARARGSQRDIAEFVFLCPENAPPKADQPMNF